jgi:hypothetical protein
MWLLNPRKRLSGGNGKYQVQTYVHDCNIVDENMNIIKNIIDFVYQYIVNTLI